MLAKGGKRTALIDFDGQGHSSIIYGVKNTNRLEITINTLLRKIMEDEPLPEPDSYVIKHESGVEVIPSKSAREIEDTIDRALALYFENQHIPEEHGEQFLDK